MSLNTIFGINGVGKDTIAEQIRKNNPNVRVTSMSRLLMYILGITSNFDVRKKVGEKEYGMLEAVPQSRMIEIENSEYRQFIERFSNSKENIIFIGHLITAMRHGTNVTYLRDRLTPDWFIKCNNNLIQVVAPFELINSRRKLDSDRLRVSDISQIKEHQLLCSQEWERIKRSKLIPASRMHIVENIELSKATNELEKIIFDKDILKEGENNSKGEEYER